MATSVPPLDSLVVGVERPDGGYYMPLFVVLSEDVVLNEPFQQQIRHRIRSALSARHVPDEIVQVPAVPRTLNGKKLEVPVKKILLGYAPERVANPGSLADSGALDPFVRFAASRGSAKP